MKIFDFLEIHEEEVLKKVCISYGNIDITYNDLGKLVNESRDSFSKKYVQGEKILINEKDPIKQIVYLLASAKAGLQVVLIDDSFPQDLIKKIDVSENTKVNHKDIFFGALSSGSTGTPKIIWRSHESWLNGFPHQSKVFNLSSKDTLFLTGSLLYTANLNSALHILFEGGALVLAESKWPRSWIKEIKSKAVTAIFMVPANYRLLLKGTSEIILGVKVLISAGEKMDIKTLGSLIEKFDSAKFFEYYGASELGHITYIEGKDLITKSKSVGKAFPNVKIEIIEGKIWVESPYLAPSYLPKATIGDLGYIDSDGYVFLLGREGSLINKGGIKIVPREIEEILISFPGIEESQVIGVPDPMKGERAVAFLKINKKISEQDISNYLKGKIPRGAVPQKFIFIEDFPRNISGKIDVKKLKNMI